MTKKMNEKIKLNPLLYLIDEMSEKESFNENFYNQYFIFATVDSGKNENIYVYYLIKY